METNRIYQSNHCSTSSFHSPSARYTNFWISENRTSDAESICCLNFFGFLYMSFLKGIYNGIGVRGGKNLLSVMYRDMNVNRKASLGVVEIFQTSFERGMAG